MANIAISLCGEGRGHASRVCTLIERLDPAHDVLVYTGGDGLEFMRHRLAMRMPRVRIESIPGIVFQYVGGRLDVMRSIAAGLDYQARQIGPLVDRMIADTTKMRPYLPSMRIDFDTGRDLEVESMYRIPSHRGAAAGVEMPHTVMLATELEFLARARQPT